MKPIDETHTYATRDAVAKNNIFFSFWRRDFSGSFCPYRSLISRVIIQSCRNPSKFIWNDVVDSFSSLCSVFNP